MAKDKNNAASLGFDAELFKAADKLRGNMEPSDYKHIALLCDTLLPQLISGELRIKDAERFMECMA